MYTVSGKRGDWTVTVNGTAHRHIPTMAIAVALGETMVVSQRAKV